MADVRDLGCRPRYPLGFTERRACPAPTVGVGHARPFATTRTKVFKDALSCLCPRCSDGRVTSRSPDSLCSAEVCVSGCDLVLAVWVQQISAGGARKISLHASRIGERA